MKRAAGRSGRSNWSTCALLLGVAVWLLGGGEAAAEKLTDSENYYSVTLGPGWEEAATTETRPPALLASYRNPATGQLLVISRVNFPNRPAWRDRPEFFAAVVAGLDESVPGYRQIKRRKHKLGRVPALDLWFHHQGTEVVMIRFLFFRTFSLSLALATPKSQEKSQRKSSEKLLTSFTPYFGT